MAISKFVVLIAEDSSTVELKESSTVALTVVVFLNCNDVVGPDPLWLLLHNDTFWQELFWIEFYDIFCVFNSKISAPVETK